MFAGGLLAFGSAAIVIPVANAQPAPSPAQDTTCSVSAIANTSSTVSASTSTYLASNPEANEALTEIAAQPQDQATQAFRTYFAENPQVESELKAINEPAATISSQCGIEVTPTPISAALTDV
ncbi:hemophore-related protein [Mycolicibacterium sp. GF69]|uniref:hemophore-related protein n=1 Tax=Mycolicibacterium sp. GF69 TaxID=2267251 RepID=UPI001F0BC13B|nr:hemophore-related protein [Mycolicibacterium sp. GF69]